jgi:hypothetical protein
MALMGSVSLRRRCHGVTNLHANPGIVFPGSGIYFWWQAGAVKALGSRFDLGLAQFAGTSGGSLAATIAACDTDPDHAFEVAWRLCKASGAFERGAWGLYGIWGGIVREWLDEILPPDAVERCRGRVNILVYRPMSSPYAVNDYATRDDLIDACLASAHVPLFMDGRLMATFRGRLHVDYDFAGFRSSPAALTLPTSAPSVRVAVGRDPRVRDLASKPGGTMQLISEEALREVMSWGASSIYAQDEEGGLNALDPLRKVPR